MNSENCFPHNSAWITWEIQVRNRSMANALNVPLYELITKNRTFRYPILILRTFMILINKRIRILFVQNPSIVLSFFVICLKPILRLRVIVDAHNSGIYPLDGRSLILNFITRLICRRAYVVIVTNLYLAKTVTEWGGNAFVLPDPIPDFSHHKLGQPVYQRAFVLFICTWAEDEPYFEVIEAARTLCNQNLDILITGNFTKKLTEDQIRGIPDNVKLMGFISEENYVTLLHHATVVIDLTTRENCLVCGGYEAAASGTPAIISETEVNREVFDAGYLYTENSAKAISAAIIESVARQVELREQLVKFRSKHQLLISSRIKDLTELAAIQQR